MSKRYTGRIKVILCTITKNNCWEWQGKRHKTQGYPYITVARDKKRYSQLLTRVILKAKLGRDIIPNKMALHTCDNPPCCNPEHLYEGTLENNTKDKIVRNRTAKGERNGGSKLTDREVGQIKVLLEIGQLSQDKIAEMYNITQSQISLIKLKIHWKHID